MSLKFVVWERVKMSSANALKLEWYKILSFGKELVVDNDLLYSVEICFPYSVHAILDFL